ncbi:MAG: sulfatase-like hydrolase/transferase [Bacteroidales bacterium]|nr:sulfatase-like hydrolase/transferase [Bacteroidales bacterium]
MNNIKSKSSTFPIILGSMVLAGSSCVNNESDKTKDQPNVIIILADDLGYGDISLYGQDRYQTTNIDQLAKEGVMLTDFYVPTPYSAPSRATLLTGRFPLRHGLTRNPAPDAGIDSFGIPDTEITLGHMFQDAGYSTKLIGKWHLGHLEEYFPVKHGFDEYYGILYSNDMRPVQIVENMDTVEYPVDQNLLTQKYTAKAIDFIQKNKDNPFFLELAHAMPHKPLGASENFYTPETPDDLYDDVIRELDWSTGRIIEELKNLNILENTIFIFMSDNGPWYGGSTGGLKGMKANTWEGGTRVPFIIRYPKMLPQNEVINVPCWSADIFPTLLSLTSIDPPADVFIDGEIITDILKGKQTDHKPIFTMKSETIKAIRHGKYKLFVDTPRFYQPPKDLENWVDWRGPDGETIIAPYEQHNPGDYPGIKPEKMEGSTFLFDLESDLTEMKDLSEEYPEIKADLLKKYNEFLESLNL